MGLKFAQRQFLNIWSNLVVIASNCRTFGSQNMTALDRYCRCGRLPNRSLSPMRDIVESSARERIVEASIEPCPLSSKYQTYLSDTGSDTRHNLNTNIGLF